MTIANSIIAIDRSHFGTDHVVVELNRKCAWETKWMNQIKRPFKTSINEDRYMVKVQSTSSRLDVETQVHYIIKSEAIAGATRARFVCTSQLFICPSIGGNEKREYVGSIHIPRSLYHSPTRRATQITTSGIAGLFLGKLQDRYVTCTINQLKTSSTFHDIDIQ